MRLDYVVSFEYELDPPNTVKGAVEALEVQTCARRAIEEAKDKHPGTQWSSVVVVLTREGLLDSKSPQD
jgi:hypothetical protein